MTLTYRVLNKLGLQLSPEYSEIRLFGALRRAALYWYRDVLHNVARFSILFGPFASKRVRPWLLRRMGAQVGERVFIGRDVFVDPLHCEMVTIESGAYVCARSMILVHQRDLTSYHKGMWIGDCEHVLRPVHIGKGVHVGIGTIVLPGVTIGEGSVIGAGALVTKDIPPHSLAVGVPAKVLREIPD